MTQDDSTATTSNNQFKLGRKGDPRMHRAVAARLRDPNISLLDALREGGFDFPADSGHEMQCHDADGVTLGQRKNQLSRRLRLARQSADVNKPNHYATTLPKSVETHTQIDTMAPTEVSAGNLSTAAKASCKRDSSALNDMEDDADMTDEMANIDRMAKYHPQFQALFPSIRSAVNIANPQVAAVSHGHGNIAVASLISTANSVGMTLEQFAMSLSNSPTLFKALSSNPDPGEKLKLAVNLYKTDARALLQKCMLLAGYESSEVVEGHARYMQVALKVWEVEGKRLELLLGCSQESQRAGAFCECLPGIGASAMTTNMASAHRHSDSCGPPESIANDNEFKTAAVDTGGRHVHRLSGKCGHKAIIHQPQGRPAHIDFVVDGKIECYEGIKPVGPRGQGAMWPSLYKCSDLACPTDPEKQHAACGSDSCCDDHVSDEVHNAHPKQLSLTDVDFDGKEWNVDFFAYDGQDDTLLGLIKVGDGDKK